VFSKSRTLAERVMALYPDALIGGTGWDLGVELRHAGVDDAIHPDYSDFSGWDVSIGFTQRGCARRCGFCVVPTKEGAPRSTSTIGQVWRGEPWPRRLLLLDNNFFAQREWRERVGEMTAGAFEVCLTQGIDLRALTEEQAKALASLKYRSLDFKSRRIYGAWDNTDDEAAVLRGIERLLAQGVEPRALMVYVLVGFDPARGPADWLYRQGKLGALGCLPYPMPYTRTPETVGFQRWVLRGYSRSLSWDEWCRAGYQAHALRRRWAAGVEQTDLWDEPTEEAP
jgi:hypothetical protein